MTNIIKIILSLLLFVCLAKLPYGYYQFVRFAALIGFGILAFKANEMGSKNEVILYVCLAMLFQPIFKIAFGRELWNIIDVIVGIGLLLSMIKRQPK